MRHDLSFFLMWYPRPDSNRHDLATEGFSYHFGFRRRPPNGRTFVVWSTPSPWPMLLTVGARRLLSTPSRRYRYPTGLVRCQLGHLGDMARAFADFDGCHPGRFPPGAQFNKSLVSTHSTTRAIRLPPIGRRFLLCRTQCRTTSDASKRASSRSCRA